MKITLFWSFSVCKGLLRDIRCERTPKKCGNNFFSGRGLPFPVNIIAPRPRTSTHCRARLRPRRSCPLVVPPRAPRGRAHLSCGMAVGRDVPIAPPVRPRRASSFTPWSRAPLVRHGGSAHCPCAPLVRLGGRARCPHRAAAPSARCVAWHPAPSLCVPLVRLAPYRTLPTRDAHVITHAKFAPPLRTHITRAARWGHRALPPLHPQNTHTITHAPPPVGAPHPVAVRHRRPGLRYRQKSRIHGGTGFSEIARSGSKNTEIRRSPPSSRQSRASLRDGKA